MPLGIANRCRLRMTSAADMAIRALQAEHPSVCIQPCSSVFMLGSGGGRELHGEGFDQLGACSSLVECLAHGCPVDKTKLAEHLRFVLQIAEHAPSSAEVVPTLTRGALPWAKSPSRATMRDCESLSPVTLCPRFWPRSAPGAWPHAQRACSLCNGGPDAMLSTTGSYEIKLVQDFREHDRGAILQGARRVWTRFYGKSRQPMSNRVDIGPRRALHGNTFTAFLRHRRVAFARLVLCARHDTMDNTVDSGRPQGGSQRHST